MKKILLFALVVFTPISAVSAAVDYTLQTQTTAAPTRAIAPVAAPIPATITTVSSGTVTGTAATQPSTNVATPPPAPQEASTDYLLKIDTIDGESKDTKGATSPTPLKIMAPAPTAAPAAMKVTAGESFPQPLTPDFSILLGGGGSEARGGVSVAAGDVNGDGYSDEQRAKIAQILLEGSQDEGAPVEQISLNYEKIKTKVRHQVKLFGFIPINTLADVEIDADAHATVHFPWWAFLASDKNEQQLGEDTSNLLLKVLGQKQEALTDGLMILRSL